MSATDPSVKGPDSSTLKNDAEKYQKEILGALFDGIEMDNLTKGAYIKKIEEETTSLILKRRIGRWVSFIALIIPLVLLFLAGCTLHMDAFKTAANEFPIVKVVIISASVLSFVIIYGILIKGMFTSPPREDNTPNSISNSNIREIMEIAEKTNINGG